MSPTTCVDFFNTIIIARLHAPLWYTAAMTIPEAFRQGVYKLRKAEWVNGDDRLELEVKDGFYGPWGTLVSPSTEERGRPEWARQRILLVLDRAEDWLEWTDPAAAAASAV